MIASRILIVDDEPQIRRVMRSTLASQGYVVSDAKTGEDAVAGLRETRADLVLLDMNLPGMGGLAACREHPGRLGRNRHHHADRPEHGGRQNRRARCRSG